MVMGTIGHLRLGLLSTMTGGADRVKSKQISHGGYQTSGCVKAPNFKITAVDA
jgi:hypothetical protein